MLLPLGIYFPVLFNIKSVKKVALYTFLCSLIIESYQVVFSFFGFVYNRTFNVDDLLVNTLGGIAGYAFYKLYKL